MSRSKFRYLVALVQGKVCRICRSATCRAKGGVCGPCAVKDFDRREQRKKGRRS